MGSGNDHKLPSSFFSLQKLTHVTLHRCAILTPSTFSGFSRLISLCFHNVNITKTVLPNFLRCCPLVKNFTLIEDDEHFTGSGYSDFVDLVQCLPSIEHLHMNCCPVKLFALGVLLRKFTNAIVHLKVLWLSGLSFVNEDELRSALLLVTNSPNLEKVKLKMNNNPMEAMSQTVMSLLDVQEYPYVNLDHLHELEITDFSGVKPEMDFVELILAKSPMLKKLRLVMHYENDYEEIGWILEELLELPRASSRAKVIVRSP